MVERIEDTTLPARRCLEHTWRQLSGQVRSFEAVAPCGLPAAGRCVLLPATVSGDPPDGAILLSIAEEDACAVAAEMFGLAAGELTPEDIDDACREVCNQLSHCLTRAYARRQVVRLGLPETLTIDQISTVLQVDTVLDAFASWLGGHCMQVAVLGRAPSLAPEPSP